MLYTIVKKCANFDDEEAEDVNKIKGKMNEEEAAEGNRKARNVIKGKIKSVAAMSKMFTTLREE